MPTNKPTGFETYIYDHKQYTGSDLDNRPYLSPSHDPQKLPPPECNANELLESSVPPLRIVAEDLWLKNASPYYNIHPKLVAKLCKMDLTKIPSNLFKMPHDLQAVNVRFADFHPEFTITENEFAKGPFQGVHIPIGTAVTSVLMAELKDRQNQRNLAFVIDFNVFHQKQPIYLVFRAELNDKDSLQSIIQNAQGTKGSITVINRLLKLVATVGFLADNPTLTQADVLNKDKAKFTSANNSQKQIIIDRAKRRGKFGFNVGTDLMFLDDMNIPKQHRNEQEQTRQLEYAHIRSGHPHTVRYGEKKQQVKIMWYVPTTVRPDLPFKEE